MKRILTVMVCVSLLLIQGCFGGVILQYATFSVMGGGDPEAVTIDAEGVSVALGLSIDAVTVTEDTAYVTEPAIVDIPAGAQNGQVMAFDSAACNVVNRIAGTPSVSADEMEISYTFTNQLEYAKIYMFCITDIEYDNKKIPFDDIMVPFETVPGTAVCTPPTTEEIAAAILAGNPDGVGIVEGSAFGEVTLPAWTCVGTAVDPTLAGLPTWAAFFDGGTLIISGEGAIGADARAGAIEITYSPYDGYDTPVTFALNDSDGGGIIDFDEYEWSVVPLINPNIGWLWRDPADEGLYWPLIDDVLSIQTGIVTTGAGLDYTDASDDEADFDLDGQTNSEEFDAETNMFVFTGTAGFSAVTTHVGAGGLTVEGLTQGDFNGDGNLDILAMLWADDTVSMILGKGDGTFEAASVVVAVMDSMPLNAVAGDFDGDGDLDAVVSFYAWETITVLLNDGTGNLSYNTARTYDAGQECYGMTPGDFDRDGNLDVAVANQGDDNVGIYFGNGDGTLDAPAPTYSVGSWNSHVAAADFNGDGYLDLASAGDVVSSVLINNGDGTFAPAVSYPVERGVGVSTADMDGDGDIDLLVASDDPTPALAVLLNNGAGVFGAATLYNTTDDPEDIVTGDLDGDGDIDVAVSISVLTEGVDIFLNDGSGVLSGPTYLAASATSITEIVMGDFNNDGKLDIIATDATNLDIFLQD